MKKKKLKKASTEKSVEKGTGNLARTVKKTRPTATSPGKGRKKTANKRTPEQTKQPKEKKLSKSEKIQLKMQVRRAEVRRLILEGMNGCAIARKLGVGRKLIESDLKVLRQEVMGFIESNEEFLTNMMTHHTEITTQLNTILREECVVIKGGEEQPSAFLKVECIKAMTSENKETANLLFKLGKIKEAPKKVEGKMTIGWQEYTEEDKKKDEK